MTAAKLAGALQPGDRTLSYGVVQATDRDEVWGGHVFVTFDSNHFATFPADHVFALADR